MIKKLISLMAAATLTIGSALAADVPYLQQINNPEQPIFAAPSYFSDYAGIVGEAGTYTIITEETDEFGALWGELKSGAGWVCLNDVRAGEDDGLIATGVPYTQQIENPDTPVLDGPGYDYAVVQTVSEAGLYTIEEEIDDGEGSLWGRLKSGAGWVNLTELREWNERPTPVTASFADAQTLAGAHHLYTEQESEYMVLLAFRAHEVLTNVRLEALQAAEYAYDASTLCTLETMTPEEPLVAGVIFYGDMTAYGISFTDANGIERHFAAYISGRNGMLVLEEYYLN